MTKNRFARTVSALGATSLLAVGLMFPAFATPGSDHTIDICHVTESAGNPYVLLTVDMAAFDGDGNNDHTHHVAKDGRIDVISLDGTCPSVGTTTTTAPSTTTTTIGT